ncbi:MAG: hypothetical protein ABIO61_11345 [Thermomonas sp.]
MSLLAELKRRNIIRMAGLYLVGAWLITQVAATVLPLFGGPDWLARSVIVALAIGFIPALALAWIFEVTPDGIKRDDEVPLDKSIAPHTARRMDRMIIAVLALAIVYFGFDKFVLAPQRAAAQAASMQAAAPAATAVRSPASADSRSIAVLPFVNMSSDQEQEYFSDGISEEILNALTKVDGLKVAGRTSSFFFKGKNENLTTIGKSLGVAHVLEGSVRKQGDKVRITAQLIRAQDGFHLWSETYDGDLKDVFALQESIARAITGKLQVILQGDQKTRLVNAGTSNPEAYALFLQATSIFNRRDGDRFREAIAALEAAIALDPAYARAHSRLAALYAILPSYTDADAREVHAKVQQYAASASRLDPTLAEPYASLGFSAGKFAGQVDEQFEAFEHALSLEPDDVTTNFWFGLGLIKAGYIAGGVKLLDRALLIEPMLPNLLRWRGLMYSHAGDAARAEKMVRRARDLGLQIADTTLSRIVYKRVEPDVAAKLWADGTKATFRGVSDGERRQVADGIFGGEAERNRAIRIIDAYLASNPGQVSQMAPLALFQLGLPSRAMEILRTRQISDTSDSLAALWSPAGKAMRDLPEFDAFMREFGFVEAWDQRGPPDLCKKNEKGDYACE